MAKKIAQLSVQRRMLFARVGWMHFYNGPVRGDERPVGGGSYNNDKIGHEVYNFRVTDEQLFGYFQPPMSTDIVALERIDREVTPDAEKLTNVLVIFVARHPDGGQVIVGWYKDAELVRDRVLQSPGKPEGYGHFCSAARRNCVLLPSENRRFEIPSGRGGIGQANICYPLAKDRHPKESRWMQEAVDFIDHYQGSNLLANPEVDAEKESAAAAEKALARSKGQGFARTSRERRAIEDHAMEAAKKHFRSKGFDVDDVSARCPYDLLCKQGDMEVHVEVKGTTTDGSAVVLTYNEVKHALEPSNACVLFILHSIRLEGKKALGGKQLIVEPWRVRHDYLTPITYTYRLPE